jgi:hypothetical protein
MADAPATLSFIPWLRRGLASGITRADNVPTTDTNNEIAVRLNFGLGVGPVDTQLDLVEPGDIAGFDSRAVVRTYPGRNESDAEFDHLAMIEFDQADLPWRYSPAAAANDQLRPWMTLLILIDDPSEVTIAPATPQQKLAQATVPLGKLPDVSESWAWAHVQVHGQTTAATVAGAVTGQPGQVVGRLVSSRALLPQTTYFGLLVPTYERGRLVGLGQDPSAVGVLDLAWDNKLSGSVTLPVYYQWRFQTGTSGSFKDLAIALTPRELPETVGRRALDVSRPGLGLPAASSTPLGAEGALESLKAAASPPPWDDTEKANWTTALANVLNTQTVSVAGNPSIKVVVPPLYGRWHAAQGALVPGSNPKPPATPPPGSNPPWFFDLNDDPGLRVGAATGTSVVQAHDQDLMASAWQQIGDLKAINTQRKVLQVGRETFTAGFDRHVTTGTRGTFISFTSRLQAHVAFGTGTALGALVSSKIPNAVLDPHFRRLSRPLGFIGRRQGMPGLPPSATSTFLDRLNDGSLDPAPEPSIPGGMGTWEDIGGAIIPGNVPDPTLPILTGLLAPKLTFWGLLFFCVARKLLISNPGRKWWWLLRMMRFGLDLIRLAAMQSIIQRLLKLRNRSLNAGDVTGSPKNPNFVIGTDTVPTSIPLPKFPLPAGSQDNADAAGFRTAFSNLLNVMHFVRPARPVGATINLQSLFDALKSALHPRQTLIESMQKRIQFFFTWQAADPLEPIMPAPEFPQPMWAPLRDLSPDWILPGLSNVGTDTAALVVTNQRFIESYMVGLNHEMGRELLWNEYPTDQRGTYFRQFWDPRGYVTQPGDPTDPAALAEVLKDIKFIHTWPKTAQLGANSARRPLPSGGQHLVLLVRSELIHRYPNVIVYASQTVNEGATESHPVFSGRIGLDVAFYGFELTPSDVTGNPGWFFVLQEQPAEPRLAHPAGTAEGGYVFASAAVDSNGVPAATGAQFAANLIEQRTRVAIHGSALLPTTP